jgi:hypothetical protein
VAAGGGRKKITSEKCAKEKIDSSQERTQMGGLEKGLHGLVELQFWKGLLIFSRYFLQWKRKASKSIAMQSVLIRCATEDLE